MSTIKQISVFLENRTGSLEEFTRLLGEGGIDLIALSIADTTDFGILRAIVSDNEKTLELVKANGYTAKLSDVLAVVVPDSPGGLATALKTVNEAGVSIEYLYSFVRRVNHQAVIIFRVDKPEQAEKVLTAAGIGLLGPDEVKAVAAAPC